MSIEQIRLAVKKKYDSPNWDAKVDKMPDRQVLAIWTRMNSSK